MNELTALWMESLRKNGSAFLRIKGRSMEPTIKMEERAKVNLVKPEQVDVGDVVVFSPSPVSSPLILFPSPSRGEGKVEGGRGQGEGEEEFIVHRIVDKFRFLDKLYFVHRGDNANGAGKPAPEFTPHLYGAGRRGELARPLSGMSIFGEDQLVGVVDTPSRCHSELKTKNLYLTPYTLHFTLYYFVRKLTIYFFIFKQLTKILITAIIKKPITVIKAMIPVIIKGQLQ